MKKEKKMCSESPRSVVCMYGCSRCYVNTCTIHLCIRYIFNCLIQISIVPHTSNVRPFQSFVNLRIKGIAISIFNRQSISCWQNDCSGFRTSRTTLNLKLSFDEDHVR